MKEIIKTVDATVENLHEVLGFIEEELEKHEASMKSTNIILVAAEEIYANIAMYAYEGQSEVGKASIAIGFVDDVISITFKDTGMAFDPLAKVDPDIHAEIEKRGIGGLGIYMVKKTMDECTYSRIDGTNIFTIRKAIK